MDSRGIRTLIVRAVGKHADHLTTTTTKLPVFVFAQNLCKLGTSGLRVPSAYHCATGHYFSWLESEIFVRSPQSWTSLKDKGNVWLH